jgi:hypothetical protein
LYFVSGQDELRYLGADGSTAVAARLPNVKGRSQAVFTVSPDDTRVAMAVFDWSQRPMKVTVYVENLSSGNRVDIFSSTSLYVWPVAWHAGSLVLAVCCVLGGAPNPYAAVAYHVANASSGLREAQLGSSNCPVVGPLVASGTACGGLCGANACVSAVDWSGQQHVLYQYKDANGIGTWAALSPDGNGVVVQDSGPTPGQYIVRGDGSRVNLPATDTPVVWWIDADTVLLLGLHAQGMNAALYRVSSAELFPVAESLGFVAGVLPGLS